MRYAASPSRPTNGTFDVPSCSAIYNGNRNVNTLIYVFPRNRYTSRAFNSRGIIKLASIGNSIAQSAVYRTQSITILFPANNRGTKATRHDLRVLPTFAGVLRKNIRTRLSFKSNMTNYQNYILIENLMNAVLDKRKVCLSTFYQRPGAASQ